jgi:uncharacterized protein (UPF0335 family)
VQKQSKQKGKIMEYVTDNNPSADRLRAFVERIERLEEEKEKTATDIREVYAELKCDGFDAKAVRAVIKLRKKAAAERAEEEAILKTYMTALGE